MLVNRVAVDKPLTARSVNGPQFTVIQGYQVPGITNGDSAIRCVYLADGASLSGFTLASGATRTNGYNDLDQRGGGLWCESTNVAVTWQSVAGVSYFLERSTNLSATPPFTPLATNLPGQLGTTSFTDTNAAVAPSLFYCVGVAE